MERAHGFGQLSRHDGLWNKSCGRRVYTCIGPKAIGCNRMASFFCFVGVSWFFVHVLWVAFSEPPLAFERAAASLERLQSLRPVQSPSLRAWGKKRNAPLSALVKGCSVKGVGTKHICCSHVYIWFSVFSKQKRFP